MKIKIYQFVALLILTLGVLCYGFYFYKHIEQKIPKTNFDYQNQILNKKEKKLYQATLKIENYNYNECFLFFQTHNKEFKKDYISLFLFEENYLVCWSDNSQINPKDLSLFKNKTGVVYLNNGVYQYIKHSSYERTIIGLILIKKNYLIQNKYLKNTFTEDLKLNENYIIAPFTGRKTNSVYSLNNTPLFSVLKVENKVPKKDLLNKSLINLSVLLIYLGFTLLVVNLISKKWVSFTLYIIFSLSSYFIFFLFPEWVPVNDTMSLLVLIMLLFLITILFFIFFSSKNKFLTYFKLIFSLTIPTISWLYISFFLQTKSLSFDYLNIDYTKINISILLICLVGFLSATFFSIKSCFTNFNFKHNKIPFFSFLSLYFISIYAGIYFYSIPLFFAVPFVLIPIIVILLNFIFSLKIISTLITSFLITFILFFSIKILNKKNLLINSINICKQIDSEKKEYASELYKDMIIPIMQDTFLNTKYKNYWNQKNEIDNYLNKKYFNGYWLKFDVKYYIFSQNDSIFLNTDSVYVNGIKYIEKIIKQSGLKSKDDGFWHSIKTKEGNLYYLGKIPLGSQNKYYLFIDFLPKTQMSVKGYPELLINNKANHFSYQNSDVVFAKYLNNNLISSSKGFEYPIQFSLDKKKIDYPYHEFLNFEGFNHFAYQKDKHTLILLSQEEQTIFQNLSILSILFILSLFFNFILQLSSSLITNSYYKDFGSFYTKIQYLVIGISCLTFILFSFGTGYYVYQQTIKNHVQILKEKMEGLHTELQEKTKEAVNKNINTYSYLSYYLIKFSNIFNTDINIYNLEGMLVSSSREKIYDKGLKSNLINSEAFYQLNYLQKSFYIHKEKIGNLKYLTGYLPLRDENNRITSYLNVPYFNTQKNLKQKISHLYALLIDSYSIILMIILLTVILFSNQLIKPLKVLKEELSKLMISNKNKKLSWHSNDEIGELINAYNQKVEEIEKSIQKFALSERDKAWREMAKQIAHEVKNPLTPMKLNIQHMEKVTLNAPEQIKTVIAKTSKSLIEQINALAIIAENFKDFAKTSELPLSSIDITPIIKNTLYLFKEKNISINLFLHKEKIILKANSDEFLRILNNLIKNAKQAIPKGQKGKITITSFEKKNKIIITIRDNGCGIPIGQKEEVFKPKFTTKTHGSGLGLAIIKSIINNWNGDIWFDSTLGEGTVFFMSFQKN